jgi:hypothetical protein
MHYSIVDQIVCRNDLGSIDVSTSVDYPDCGIASLIRVQNQAIGEFGRIEKLIWIKVIILQVDEIIRRIFGDIRNMYIGNKASKTKC